MSEVYGMTSFPADADDAEAVLLPDERTDSLAGFEPVGFHHAYEPDYYVAPGETIAESIEELEMSEHQLAHLMHIDHGRLERLIEGEEVLDEDLARRLEKAIGIPARMWLALEHNYRKDKARLEGE